VSHEAVRQWCRKFGQDYANQLRHRRPRPGDEWHLDEVFLTINGKRHYLWRAVDQDDNVLDILVQSRRNKQATKKFFRKLLKSIVRVATSTTAVRIRIDRRANGNIACRGLNQRGMRSDFCPRMVLLPSTFDPGGICCQRRSTVRRRGVDSRVGPR
jgi:transposase-like protein